MRWIPLTVYGASAIAVFVASRFVAAPLLAWIAIIGWLWIAYIAVELTRSRDRG